MSKNIFFKRNDLINYQNKISIERVNSAKGFKIIEEDPLSGEKHIFICDEMVDKFIQRFQKLTTNYLEK